MSSKDQIQLLLEKMRSLDDANRQAYFICSLCFYISPKEYYFFEGRLYGQIGHISKGEFGFGYDPIFYPDSKELEGKSLAQVPDWKAKNSHRSKAVEQALKFFSARI